MSSRRGSLSSRKPLTVPPTAAAKTATALINNKTGSRERKPGAATKDKAPIGKMTSKRRSATVPNAGPIRYHYLLLPGNNSGLVREAFRRRSWWAKVPEAVEGAPPPPGFNLRWKSITDKIPWTEIMRSNIRQMVNHIPKHSCLTTKSGLYRHIEALCHTEGLEIDSFVPRTLIISPVAEEGGPMEGEEALRAYLAEFKTAAEEVAGRIGETDRDEAAEACAEVDSHNDDLVLSAAAITSAAAGEEEEEVKQDRKISSCSRGVGSSRDRQGSSTRKATMSTARPFSSSHSNRDHRSSARGNSAGEAGFLPAISNKAVTSRGSGLKIGTAKRRAKVESSTAREAASTGKRARKKERPKGPSQRAWLVKPAQNTNRGVGIKISANVDKIIAWATRPSREWIVQVSTPCHLANRTGIVLVT